MSYPQYLKTYDAFCLLLSDKDYIEVTASNKSVSIHAGSMANRMSTIKTLGIEIDQEEFEEVYDQAINQILQLKSNEL